MTNHNDAMLTIALHYASRLKVQTALIGGKRDLAREYLKGYIEGALEESNYIDDVEDSRLAPHERAARRLNACPGPLVRNALDQVLGMVIQP
jgi:hypothetical protein